MSLVNLGEPREPVAPFLVKIVRLGGRQFPERVHALGFDRGDAVHVLQDAFHEQERGTDDGGALVSVLGGG